MKKVILLIFLLCSIAVAEKPYLIIRAFNAGELWEGLTPREDLAKYHSGCSLMENMIPIPQGGAEKRPGTKYVAESKNNTKIRLLPFEYSTEQSYVIELGNQYMRFFTNRAAVNTGNGTETLPTGNIVAHWLLNDNNPDTVVADDDGGTHNGTATANTDTIHIDGKVGVGSFDLDVQYAAAITDHNDFSFDDSGSNPFSIACWGYVTTQSGIQVLLSKWKESTAREWRFSLNNERKLQLHLSDDSISIAGIVSHWKLNENAGNTSVVDTIGLQNGVSTANTSTLSAAGAAANTDLSFDFDNQYAVEVADNAAYSFDDSGANPFSIAAWVFVEVSTDNQYILSKYDSNSGAEAREWYFRVRTDERFQLSLYDESANAIQGRTSADALSAGWHFLVATYDGRGGTGARNGITLYVDGSSITADIFTTGGTYTAMENLATKVVIGAVYDTGGSLSDFSKERIDNIALFSTELTQANITNMWNSGNGTETLSATFPSAIADDAIRTGWHFLAATYTGAGGATAANGMILYVDGAAIDSTKTNEASYVAMENTVTTPKIGCQESAAAANEKFWGDKIDEVSIFSDVLTPAEISTLYDEAPYEIETPYLTADLFELKMEQSADVLYITHPDYETRKLSRYANTDWTLPVFGAVTGPFRTQNTDEADTIAASATTGSVTLTASGHLPFVIGTTTGHEPGGSAVTSKSQTGALFKLVHPLATLAYQETLEDNYSNSQTENASWVDLGTLYEGTTWTLVTTGTWTGTLEIQRNYTVGAAHGASGWEKVLQYISADDRNVSTTGTEDIDAASYRAILTASGDAAEACQVDFGTDQTEHIGIVKITSVASPTSAIGTVVQTLASTDATHKWSEGSWSNYRGWPIAVTFFEDRLVFGGNASQPDTIWGSVTADYENMEAGVNDDDAVVFTLSSRQVNVIQWLVGKNRILIGTSGAEWSLSGAADEPLTPSNVKAEQQSTYGNANLQANLANESVLFFQRGAEKMRELAYNWELNSYVAPDMTILAKEVTGGGITDTAFQQIPDSILWCVRDDGELAIFSYERKEQITAWSRLITDGDFESVAAIHGTTEDEIYVSVERTIDSNTVRNIEYFSARDFGNDPCDAFYIDCGATYTTDVNVISDLTWLEGESVVALADGDVISGLTVASDTVTLGGVYQQVQIGLPYTVQLKTMPLSWVGQGMTIQGRIKRINEVIPRWYESGDFYIGRDSTDKELVAITGQTTDEDNITFPAGYDRPGYVYIYQLSPEPLTILALMIEFMIY